MLRYLIAGLLLVQAIVCAAEKPKITVSKETTFVTEPINEDGFVDLTTAINQRMSAGITTENNAAAIIFPAVGPTPDGSVLSERFFAALGVPVPPKEGDYFNALEEYLVEQGVKKSSIEMQAIVKNRDTAMNRPWKRDEFPKIAAWLDSETNPLDIIVKGIQRESYFCPINSPGLEGEIEHDLVSTLLPHIQASRSVTRALMCRVMLHTQEGRTKAAWKDLLASYRFGLHIGHGMSLIEGLVGVGNEAYTNGTMLRFLEVTQPDTDLALQYIEDLESLPQRVSVADQVDFGARLIVIDMIIMQAAEVTGEKPRLNVDWDQILRDANDWFDRIVIDLKHGSFSEREKAWGQFHSDYSEVVERQKKRSGFSKRFLLFANDKMAVTEYFSDMMISLFIPKTRRASVGSNRQQQKFDNLRVALALAAYHSDHKAYPEKLAQLAPKYLPSIPEDLFGEKPLTYRRIDEGYILYSVGSNQIDDGGKSFDVGKDDLVVRVPSR